VLDIMALRQEVGEDRVLFVCGNHELPHIYGMTLAKGTLEFTARFEHRLGFNRDSIITLFKSLPFLIRTAGGTLLTHAGASASVSTQEVADHLLTFSHDGLLTEVDGLFTRDDVWELMLQNVQMSQSKYDDNVWRYLAVSSPEDPRYADLLRGFMVGNMREFQPLWDLLFTQCENGMSESVYAKVLTRFLTVFSSSDVPQKVLVTGHITARDGYKIIAKNQLRVASWSHAAPQKSGKCLLFDTAMPVSNAEDLMPYLISAF
jgi:hypothetical protein